MRHRIAWRNVVTGSSGHGEWRAITPEEAQADASDLDRSGPEVRYWAEAERSERLPTPDVSRLLAAAKMVLEYLDEPGRFDRTHRVFLLRAAIAEHEAPQV